MAQTDIENLATTLAGLDTILGVKNISEKVTGDRKDRNADKEVKASRVELEKSVKKMKAVDKDTRDKNKEKKVDKKH